MVDAQLIATIAPAIQIVINATPPIILSMATVRNPVLWVTTPLPQVAHPAILLVPPAAVYLTALPVLKANTSNIQPLP